VAGKGADDQSYLNTVEMIEDIVDTLRRPPSRDQYDLRRASGAQPQQLRHRPTHRCYPSLPVTIVLFSTG